MIKHKSVLVDEVLHYLNPQPNKIYLDVTFGSGGHTRAILEKEPKCSVIAVDWDKETIEENGSILQEEFPDRLTLLWGNFAYLAKLLNKINVYSVEGILADFGTSQSQLLEGEGFSFNKETFLDMRMSPAHQKITAFEVINKFPEDKLREIFFELGQERYSKEIVKEIIHTRKNLSIETTKQLAELIEKLSRGPKKKIHPATKVFQALRIYINHELENIHAFLFSSLRLLNLNGRLVCISFHSLEDRLVKNFFREHDCKDSKPGFKILTRNVVSASLEEIAINPSSRSAKLRAAEKC